MGLDKSHWLIFISERRNSIIGLVMIVSGIIIQSAGEKKEKVR